MSSVCCTLVASLKHRIVKYAIAKSTLPNLAVNDADQRFLAAAMSSWVDWRNMMREVFTTDSFARCTISCCCLNADLKEV